MKPPRVNLSQLVTFYLVAKEGGLSQAAEKLCITQPAVTMQIKTLEGHFGVKLITAKRNKVQLTKAGEMLLPYAEEIYQVAIKAEGCLESYSTTVLRIGVSAALTLYITPVIERFKDLYPAVRVKLREGRSIALVDELLDFEHDLCVVASLGGSNEHLTAYRLPHAEQMVLVAAPENPLAKKLRVTWEDVARFPLILHCEGSMARKVILDEFKHRGIDPSIGAEIDSVECMKQLIREGKGVALMFLPNVQKELDLQQLKVLPLPDGGARIGVDIVHRREVHLSRPCENFLSLVKKHFGAAIQSEHLNPDKR
jgi:DNA-binding transcriptional LysR family regulator